jgi:hypothetical protein
MNQHPVQVLDPVFDYLDGVIRDHGDTLFMVFTYAAIPFLIWVLCGGLRRKLLKGKPMPHVPPVIVIHIPVGRPTPPPEPFNPFPPYHEPPHCDHDDYYRD